MTGFLAMLLANQAVRRDLIAQVVAKVIPVLVSRGYVTAGSVNAEKITQDLLKLVDKACVT